MNPDKGSGDFDLRHYLAVVRRRKLTIVLAVVAMVGSALAVSLLQTPVYQATSQIVFQTGSAEEIFAPQGFLTPTLVATEIEVMKSQSVRDAVASEIGSVPAVDIAPVANTNVVAITAESTDPAAAARTANAYAQIYTNTRRQAQIDDLLEAGRQVQAKVDELDQQLAEVERPLNELDAQIAATVGAEERRRLEDQRRALQGDIAIQRQTLQSQRSDYAEQRDKLQLASSLTQTAGAQVVTAATEPTTPVRPKPLRNAALALVAGLVLGVGLALLRDHLDDTVTSKEDLERATTGLDVLALIPAVPGWRDRQKSFVVSLTEPNSPPAEAYRSLRTAVQFIGLNQPVRVIQMTSPNASEGKTTTLANLAVALANAGQRVIVVCCDLRRPRIHEFFGLDNAAGFTSVLLGELPLSAALQTVPGAGRLALLASGPPPPNPSELLASMRTNEVFAALRSECDVVLVDSPPVLPVTDATVLARMVDATILVGTAGRTTRREYHRSIELLRQVEAPIVGTVLNGIEPEGMYGYGYRYSSETPADGGGGGKARRKRPGKAPANGRPSNGTASAGDGTTGDDVPVATGAGTDGPIVVSNPTDTR
ncbi:MAG: polysaccharide biosynthesis tyrosine autokinase [Actinobacteria bacterium]|nr:polysaccharide biosynthesis tyrosine autokinase [Actinomycetota bacterium]